MTMTKQKGSSTVEFAMLLPVLLLLVFMISEFGMMFYRLNAMTKSVQNTARYLTDVSVNSKITLSDGEIKNLVCFGNAAGSGVSILPECDEKLVLVSPVIDSGHVTITATYTADWLLAQAVVAFLRLSGEPLTLTASSVMRFTL